jgi:hypothetical protein
VFSYSPTEKCRKRSDLEIGGLETKIPPAEPSLSKYRFQKIVILSLCAGGRFGSYSSDWVIDYHLSTPLDHAVKYLSGSQISLDVVRAKN